jgi:UDP-N-acetylmuramate--L-alanine ligase/UDP-N-acetylenolpyruvoylglucosamine reductase
MVLLTPEQAASLLESAPRGATIYLVGIGGCGMSALAHLLLDAGFRVAGSDLEAGAFTRELEQRGARIHLGHAASQVLEAQPALVVYSSAVRLTNPELQAAGQLQAPLARRAVLLAALMHRQRGLAVAGMHGKTTTTALLAFALEQLSANPSFAVGAPVPQLPRHARLSPGAAPPHFGDEPFFVAEADESDGTLSCFQPHHAIVLNVDEEHLDYFANLEAVCREFEALGRNTSGKVVFCADDPHLAELFSRRPGSVSYGFHPLASYRLVRKSSGDTSTLPLQAFTESKRYFEVWHKSELLGEFSTRLLGEKNISNAGAVVALLHQLGYEPEQIALAIADFTGAARRQEKLFADARFGLFDDYGHHPAEIEATLRAFKQLGARRLLVVFQPHRYTRTQHLLGEFATCFRDADKLWITDIYAASEPEIPGVTGERLVEAVRAAEGSKAGVPTAPSSLAPEVRRAAGEPPLPPLPPSRPSVEFIRTTPDLRRVVRAAMLPGDTVVFLGAGDITHAAHALAAELTEESVTPKEAMFSELSAALSKDSVVRRDEPLAKRTTLRVGGNADFYVEPSSESDLAATLKFCAAHGLKFTLLGRGSNLLIRDGGVRGAVICLCHPNFSRLEVAGDRLHCGAGAKVKQVATTARRAGLTGLEFLEGIPGSLGGSMRMNAGAMGSWLFDVVDRIRFMDYVGEVHERPASEVTVEYRGCPLFKNHIALGAVLKGQPAPAEAIRERMTKFSEKRWESQPAAPSAGCIFKNPKTIPAGRLIDELGLKGTRVGGAVVSDVHGNFIVNDGNATARDVLGLIDVIKERARAARGIELETEVEILGEG